MKRAMFPVLTVLVLFSLAGCARLRCGSGGYADGCCADRGCCSAGCQSGRPCCDDPNNCNDACPCGQKHCRWTCRLFGHHSCAAKPRPEVATGPIGAVAYPYYTVRGPRDFLAKNPTTIGP
jgi:hypothetical protein